VAAGAYFAGRDGDGVVVADHAVPAAQDVVRGGWLKCGRDGNGDLSFWWSATADAAFELNGSCRAPSAGRTNEHDPAGLLLLPEAGL
jgi:hypothetical protein